MGLWKLWSNSEFSAQRKSQRKI